MPTTRDEHEERTGTQRDDHDQPHEPARDAAQEVGEPIGQPDDCGIKRVNDPDDQRGHDRERRDRRGDHPAPQTRMAVQEVKPARDIAQAGRQVAHTNSVASYGENAVGNVLSCRTSAAAPARSARSCRCTRSVRRSPSVRRHPRSASGDTTRGARACPSTSCHRVRNRCPRHRGRSNRIARSSTPGRASRRDSRRASRCTGAPDGRSAVGSIGSHAVPQPPGPVYGSVTSGVDSKHDSS